MPVGDLPKLEEERSKDKTIEKNAAGSNGIIQQQSYNTVCNTDLNCDCHLAADCGDGAGVTGEYDAGSYAYQSAHNTQLPDKLYCVEAISCRDETSNANEEYARQDVGSHTFTIEGSITVNEKYENSQNNCRQGREKANGCAHKEQRIKL